MDGKPGGEVRGRSKKFATTQRWHIQEFHCDVLKIQVAAR